MAFFRYTMEGLKAQNIPHVSRFDGSRNMQTLGSVRDNWLVAAKRSSKKGPGVVLVLWQFERNKHSLIGMKFSSTSIELQYQQQALTTNSCKKIMIWF